MRRKLICVVVAAPESIRNQAMGHRSQGIFEKHYRTPEIRWDSQSTYRGTPQQTELVLAGGNKLLQRDLNAPNKLSAAQEVAIMTRPDITSLRMARTATVRQCQSRFGTLKQTQHAGDTTLWKEYTKADQALRSTKRKLRQEVLREARQTWFAMPRDNTGSSVHRATNAITLLEDRAKLASILWDESKQAPAKPSRLLAINLMATLCSRQEPKGRMTYPAEAKSIASDHIRDKLPMRCSPHTCLFCLKHTRERSLSTRYRLARHLEKMHYPYIKMPAKCPHPSCMETIKHIHHFQAHASTVHGITFTKKAGREAQTKWNDREIIEIVDETASISTARNV